MSRAPRPLAVLAVAVSAGWGCAFAATPLGMVPAPPSLAMMPAAPSTSGSLLSTGVPAALPTSGGPLSTRAPAAPRPASVNVRSAGGAETRLWGKSQISNAALAEAVQSALADAELFLPLVDRAADYQLEVVLERLEQPDWGVVTTVRVSTRWRLTRTGAAQPLWTDVIAASDTATLLDAVIGTRRCRLATEGAAREAIREGIARLGRVPLP